MANLMTRLRGDTTAARFNVDDWLEALQQFTFNGVSYPLGMQTTLRGENVEPIGDNFVGLVQGALRSSGVVAAVEMARLTVFSEARFQFQQMRDGRPGDLFGTDALALLERPEPGLTIGDLLTRMLMDADFAGNSFQAVVGGDLIRMRPDWTDIVLEPRMAGSMQVGFRRAGYRYYENGDKTKTPAMFDVSQVAHFAPLPDPLANYRGMSWLTPVIREIQSHKQAARHKLNFFKNAATPNLAVSLPMGPTPMTRPQFDEWVDAMQRSHAGPEKAGKTLFTANGADVTVIGADMKQLDFKAVQGHAETVIAAAGGVGAVVAQLSEGLQGSSLNAGNFAVAKRRAGDMVFRPLWRNAAGSLETLVPPPADARLWYDTRDINFLREDEEAAAKIEQVKQSSITGYVRDGFSPESAVAAVAAQDVTLLEHTGKLSVQLQEPGDETVNGENDESDADD